LADTREAVRRILRRVAALPPDRRKDALAQLLILSGLRQLMPITLDIEENCFLKVFCEQAKREGEQEGRTEGEQFILSRMLERRFGPLPDGAVERIEGADTTQLEAWGLRLLEARTLEEALQ
jgi:hypothetical protein